MATFVGSGCTLQLRVHDITEQVLTIEMRRADIGRLQVGAPGAEPYGDRFLIRNCDDEFEAKVLSVSDQLVILRLPRSTVAALEVEPTPGTAVAGPKGPHVGAAALPQAGITPRTPGDQALAARSTGPAAPSVPQSAPGTYAYAPVPSASYAPVPSTHAPVPSAAYGTQSAYANALRAYDAAQPSYGGYGAYGTPGAYGPPGAYGTAGIYGAAGAYGPPGAYGTAGVYGAPGAYGIPGAYGSPGVHVTPPASADAEFGGLRGRMLVDGKPYAGCRVTLRPLDTGFKGLFAAKERPQLFVAVTDAYGVYRFEQLPEGPYDIYWMPPGKDYWVRVLKQEPTVVIHAGALVQQPDINADMKVL